jgi:hypothetical protein
LMFRRSTAENLTQVHEFLAVKTASGCLQSTCTAGQEIVLTSCLRVCVRAPPFSDRNLEALLQR